MDKLYAKILIWSINKLVCRQKTYQGRLNRLNNIIKFLIDVYYDYSKRSASHDN